ncbi:SDR family NAD(P)-dependent oxidoreductase [Pseudomonas sp. nanlin1]|uniref:SDR family NAD(P)-dependent oxidoreductase n=1 Tax=Pseudomonas sp. nanlin1 TaxID=3040605 RepID=UPI00388EFA34
MAKVLITGAGGFIGQALCQRLAQQGNEVVALVRRAALSDSGITYKVADLEDPDSIALSDLQGVDCIVHLAGRAHVMKDSSAQPLEEYRKVNRDATLRFAQQALEAGVKRFVFVSSIGVNGAQTFGTPFDETSLARPHADYAVSKWEAEEGVRALLGASTMEWVIVRPPMVYDAAAPGNFARLMRLAASGLPLPLAKVDNKRSIISLRNLTAFLSLCTAHTNAANQLFLIADDQAVSTPRMVELLCEGMGKGAKLFYCPSSLLLLIAGWVGRSNIHTQLYGSLQIDTGKAKQLLGWKAEESVDIAIRNAGAGFKKDA